MSQLISQKINPPADSPVAAPTAASPLGEEATPCPAKQPQGLPTPPPSAFVLIMVFWMLLGGAAGIKIMQSIWHILGVDIGSVAIAVPVGGVVGALAGGLLGLISNPRWLVLLMAVFAGSAAGGVAGQVPWGAIGQIGGQVAGGVVGVIVWATWLFFGRGKDSTAEPVRSTTAVGGHPGPAASRPPQSVPKEVDDGDPRDEHGRVPPGAGRSEVGQAGLRHENQPYVVPVTLAYDEVSRCLYGFTTPGQKIEWMRANPLVCVEVDEVAADDQWVSVIAFGRYEEVPEGPESDGGRLPALELPRRFAEAPSAWSADSHQRQCDDERERAWQVLQTHPMWWQPASSVWAARAHRDPAEPFHSVYYKIRIDRVTGREATLDARDAIAHAVPGPHIERWGRLRWTTTRVLGGK